MKVSVVTGVVVLLCLSSRGWCEPCRVAGELRCGQQDKCVPLRYICDNDPDCTDNSDEDPELCKDWMTTCGRGEVPCDDGSDDGTRCISVTDYCNDPTMCHTHLDLRICQMLHNQRLQRFAQVVLTDFGPRNNFEESEAHEEEFVGVVNGTLSHPACPHLYTLVGDQCISIFFPAAVSWGESRGLCRLLGGDLLTSTNLTHFAGLLAHLHDNHMTGDFWVGGRYVNSSLGWAWLDHYPMELGSPFWAVRHYNSCESRNMSIPEAGGRTRTVNDGACYHYQQAPQQKKEKNGHQQGEPVEGWCAALTYQHYYYLTDEDCLAKKSPICVHDLPYQKNKEMKVEKEEKKEKEKEKDRKKEEEKVEEEKREEVTENSNILPDLLM